ncbi:response regulator transcription factor [Jeotgalibacillus sp. S-D1]|uniref:response regulator n=1 Tax=Jeotgalibacillus sp. S-D1 TaxID=2552189 RepID=UPI001059BD46|nr:response regulator [Jeotgalibacillus sp. S-D1]TDL33074.1 response regulator transcription factor [Jeotgalibacillus sp. S-D1]
MQRIMIIEDDTDLRLDLADQIVESGYQPIPVTDFERIIEIFNEEKPDLVLTNVALPFFDGYYWYRQIREHSKCPVIYLSKEDSLVNIEVAFQDKKRNVDVKPFSKENLTATLNNQLFRKNPYNK